MKEETIKGVVVTEGKRYYVEVDDKRWELEAGGVVIDGFPLEKLVDTEVEVLFSEPQRHIVGLIATEVEWIPGPILCYIPAPDFFRHTQLEVYNSLMEELRDKFIEQLHEEGIINAEVFEKLQR